MFNSQATKYYEKGGNAVGQGQSVKGPPLKPLATDVKVGTVEVGQDGVTLYEVRLRPDGVHRWYVFKRPAGNSRGGGASRGGSGSGSGGASASANRGRGRGMHTFAGTGTSMGQQSSTRTNTEHANAFSSFAPRGVQTQMYPNKSTNKQKQSKQSMEIEEVHITNTNNNGKFTIGPK